MKRVTGVISTLVAIATVILWACSGVVLVNTVSADTTPVLIVGIQTGSDASATEERIVLANVSDKAMDLSGYVLGYFSAKPKSLTVPSRTIKLQGNIAVGQHFELASTGYMTDQADQFFTNTLSSAGGHLRLSNVAGEELDRVGWGTATAARGQAASAPKDGELLMRRMDNQQYRNTGNNAEDFGEEQQSVAGEVTVGIDSGLIISELLPDPASPASDSADEYIELHNTSTSEVNLQGLMLAAGPSLGAKHILAEQTMQPGEYKALFITETKLSLSNSGSKVQLTTSDGQVLAETIYPKAIVGAAWAWSGSDWQWTDSPTPHAPNILSVPTTNSKTTTAKPKKVTTTKKAAKKSSVKKPTAADKAAKKSSKPIEPKPKVNNSIVAGVGSAAVLYGAYEYRQDMASIIRKLRGNRKNR